MTTDEIMDSVDQLRNLLSSDSDASQSLTLATLPGAIRNRQVERVKAFVATSEDDREAVDKWFSHRERGDSKQSEVDVYVVGPEDSPDYVVVRSEMWSHRKANNRYSDDDDGTYHAVWIVGPGDDGADFFIHRLDWSKRFEYDSQEWTSDDIRQHLGFETDLPPKDEILEPGVRYRAHGDIWLELEPYDEYIERHVKNRTRAKAFNIESQQKEGWYNDRLEGVSGAYYTNNLLTITVNSTDELKRLQEDLGISEETIRSLMKDDWQRLTANRRESLIKRALSKEYTEEVDPVEEPSADDVRTEFTESHVDQARRRYLQIGNHLAVIHDALSPSEAVGTTPRGRTESEMICPVETTIELHHDEHTSEIRTLPPCRIELGLLTRHQQN